MVARIAFYAPIKPPDHPIPSGDRQMARMLFSALERAGYDTFLASREILYSKRHGAEHMAARREKAHAEAARLLEEFAGSGRKPDLWFSYHPYDKSPDWLGEEICDRLSIPFVAAEPCKTSQGPNGEWAAWRNESKRIIAKAAMNLVMTHSDLEFVSGFVPPERIAWFDPFIDVEQLDAEPVGFDPWAGCSGARLISVGMMRQGAKTESYAVLAAALRLVDGLDWKLVVVGGGPEEAAVRSMFSEFREQRVVFAGERSPGEVLALMELSDVLAWPGCREAYGMVYLEAASRAKPAVALRNMGVPRVVENGRTGLLADPPDAATYAACLRTIIENPALRRALGKGALEFVYRRKIRPSSCKASEVGPGRCTGRTGRMRLLSGPQGKALEKELGEWRSAGRSPRLFFRDDDAVSDTPALQRLFRACETSRAPLLLAAIPEPADESLGRAVRAFGLVTGAVHGFRHANHAPKGEKPCELDRYRGRELVIGELREGRAKLTALFGGRLSQLLVPPWNRIHDEIAAHVHEAGFAGIPRMAG